MAFFTNVREIYQRASSELQRQAQRLRDLASGPGSPVNSQNTTATNATLNSTEQSPGGNKARGIRFVEPEDDAEEDDMEPAPRVNNIYYNRRKSVAAESYDPEKEDSDEENSSEGDDMKTPQQRDRLDKAVKDILLFRCLDEKQKDTVIKAMREIIVNPGDTIITQGDEGENFYIIEKGKYDIFVKSPVSGQDNKVGAYEDKGSFGELALMYNTPRAATIVATSPGIIWSLDRSTFRRIVLKSAFHRRQMYERLLKAVPLLKELNDYERANLADALHTKEFQDGQQIISQGEEGKHMFFIEEGEVRIVYRSNGPVVQEKQVNLLKPGSYFGELALITKQRRQASAFAVGLTKLAVLDIDGFERLMGPCLTIMQRNIDSYRNQLKDAFGTAIVNADLRLTA